MIYMEVFIFVLIVSLLLIHEMDAIRVREWRMFIGLKNLHDETAYRIFSLAHLPLYIAAFFILASGGALAKLILYYVIDAFLIVHAIIHYGFRKNPNNGFTSLFSKAIIYSLAILAIIHLCVLLVV